MWCITHLYIIPSLPWSLSAFFSCSPIYGQYALFNEKASGPKRSWGSWIITFDVHFGSRILSIIFMSRFFMVGSEYRTA